MRPARTRDLSAVEVLIRRAAGSPRVINLGGGLPTESQFPRAALAAAFRRAVGDRDSVALQYGWPEGQASLRTRIARRLSRRCVSRAVSPDDVIVTSGARQAIALAIQLVTKPGDAVGVDAATYPAALDLFRMRGLRLAPLGKGAVQYLVPSIGNPTGRPLEPSAHRAAVGAGSWLIEDDAYAELRFDGRTAVPLLAHRPGLVLHVGTFSKTLCPGLRVGWLVVPRRLRRRALALKQGDDLQSNSLSQAVIDEYLAHVDFDAYLRTLRAHYERRAMRLLAAVRRQLPGWTVVAPEGGFSLWLEADARVDEQRLLARAVSEGVCFDLGETFQAFPEPSAPTRLRLCYSLASPATFEEGARRLARAWRRAVGKGASARGRASSRRPLKRRRRRSPAS